MDKWMNRMLSAMLCVAMLAGAVATPALAEEAPAPAVESPADAVTEEAPAEEEGDPQAPEATEEVEQDEAEPKADDVVEADADVDAEQEPAAEEIAVELAPDGEAEAEDEAEEVTLRLGSIIAGSREAALGGTVRWKVKSEGASAVNWQVERSDGEYVDGGAVVNGAFRWKPAATGVYLVTVIAALDGEEAAVTETVTVRGGAFSAAVRPAVRYAVAGRSALRYAIDVTGGLEPYDVRIELCADGRLVYATDSLEREISYMPSDGGNYTLKLQVTDAEGAKGGGEVTLPVSVDEYETRADWEATLPALRDDMTFAERLVKVARSQVGYVESNRNFIVGEDGKLDGYTRYGDWYHMPYEEWCAMFVSFCLHYAGIGKDVIPRHANNQRWKKALGERYIDDEDGYRPEAGDIVFFHHNRDDGHTDPNFPNHVGIVVRVDDRLHTVEGNTVGRSVRERDYPLDDAHIVGYMSMRRVMARHDRNYRRGARVTFVAPEGVTVRVNGMAVDGGVAEAQNGSIVFELVPDAGLTLGDVVVSGGLEAILKDGVYTVDGIRDDMTVVEISARE